ncbi:NIPSNAP family protein [Rheinheimera fenheensis]|uniref:NIPSNAP family protein n=1 Tax=Rheinheimera fenheensis TaxID=3152295 RepID=UPI00325DCB7C
MITCHIKYEIYPEKVFEFEHYAKLWLGLVEKFGGIHHGYFLPSEGANDIAYAIFSFNSFTDYEKYRKDSLADAESIAAYHYARDTQCIRRYERSFLRPLLKLPSQV